MTHPTTDDGREYLTAAEAAALAGISLRTLYRRVAEGTIKPTRMVGTRGPYRFTREDVDSWFQAAS